MRASGAWLHDALRASRRDRLTAGLKVALPSPAIRSLLAVALDDPQWGSEEAHEILESAVVSSLPKSLRALKVPYRPTPLRGQQQADWIEPARCSTVMFSASAAPHTSLIASTGGPTSPARVCGGGRTARSAL